MLILLNNFVNQLQSFFNIFFKYRPLTVPPHSPTASALKNLPNTFSS